MADERYSNYGKLSYSSGKDGIEKEDFAKVMAASIIELVIPVIEQRCSQISEEIHDQMKRNNNEQ